MTEEGNALASARSPKMASTASPLASLTTALDTPLQIHPRILQRTPSSSSRLPTKSTIPRISLVLPNATIPEDIRYGVNEVAREAVRGNVRVVEGEQAGKVGEGVWVWTVR